MGVVGLERVTAQRPLRDEEHGAAGTERPGDGGDDDRRER